VQRQIHCILLILSKASHAVSRRLSSTRKKNDARAGQLLLSAHATVSQGQNRVLVSSLLPSAVRKLLH
jgi:hypothetical protein